MAYRLRSTACVRVLHTGDQIWSLAPDAVTVDYSVGVSEHIAPSDTGFYLEAVDTGLPDFVIPVGVCIRIIDDGFVLRHITDYTQRG